MRIIKEHSFKHGLNDISIEARDEATLDRLIAKINAAGWRNEWTQCSCDCDYGFATEYAILHTDAELFRAAFRDAKAELSIEIAAEHAEQAAWMRC